MIRQVIDTFEKKDSTSLNLSRENTNIRMAKGYITKDDITDIQQSPSVTPIIPMIGKNLNKIEPCNNKETDSAKLLSSTKYKSRLYFIMRIQNQYLREFIAEVFGTFLLLIFINGSVAQNLFFSLDNVAFSSNLTINICIGFGVSMAVLTVGKVSGAHLNPAVSLSNFLIGNLSIKRFITYISAQFIGGFLGAGAIFVLYHDQISNYERSLLQKNETVEFFSLKTASIFATYPNEHLTILSALFDQIFGTAILIIFVLALSDKKNEKMSHASVAAYVGVAVMIIGMAFGYNCGYAINPARDLSPRLLTFLAGWGPQVFEFRNYFWIPIAGPAIGSIVGTVLYYILIGNNWPYNEIETHNKWEITDV